MGGSLRDLACGGISRIATMLRGQSHLSGFVCRGFPGQSLVLFLRPSIFSSI